MTIIIKKKRFGSILELFDLLILFIIPNIFLIPIQKNAIKKENFVTKCFIDKCLKLD